MRRLRLHGLIERVAASFRYRVTDRGFRVALFFTRVYNRILRPGSADLLLNLGALANILTGLAPIWWTVEGLGSGYRI